MDADANDSTDSSRSATEEPERGNRWTGHSSTWRSLTVQEQELDQSLLELRNRDLSIHLYNTFALRERARKHLEAKKLKSGASPSRDNQSVPENDDEDIEDSAGREWVPQKVWTSWPLTPQQVPRLDERIGTLDKDEIYTFKRREKERPSRELEDVLVGTALKFAKEKWNSRQMAPIKETPQAGTNDGEPMNLEDESEREEHNAEKEMSVDYASGADEKEKPEGKRRSRSSLKRVPLKPVLSADDDRSRDLLRPSIRHILSQLDSVLMALHYARQTCRRYASDSDYSSDDDDDYDGREASKPGRDQLGKVKRSRDEALTEGEGAEQNPTKRPVGRPRKFENLTSRPKSADGGTIRQGTEVDYLARTKTTRLGRPKKHYEALEGETQDEYIVRIARLQKKPLPLITLNEPPTSPTLSLLKGKPASFRRDRLGIRDWSEVLGSAALVGFSPDVIARSAQRCANLFGESMTMMELVENTSKADEDDVITTYVPEEIPDLDDELESSSDDNDEESLRMKMTASKVRTSVPGHYNVLCPIESCPRHVQGFSRVDHVKRHLKKIHKLSSVEANKLLKEEEMHGGVHVDGFLKPIKTATGVRGADKHARSQGRWEKKDVTASEELSDTKMEDDEPGLE